MAKTEDALIDGEAPGSGSRITRVTAPKASDMLAAQLRERIRSGDWGEGVALPTERDLASQSGLSRASVREALRMLEVDGLVEIRPGRNGGARVRRPAGEGLTRHLELFIWGQNIGFEHLHDVREALEALGAHGAARSRTDRDIEELVVKTEAVERAADDLGRYLDANLEWHLALVRASHNPLLVSFMEVLANAIHRSTESEVFDSPEVRASTLQIHRAILDAIIARDADAARRRMTRHVAAARTVALSAGHAEPMATVGVRPARRTARKAHGKAAGKATAKRAARNRVRGADERS
jgi:GntR family transcriptional regulator, transcriptional repressor for pyruvate dehydrogenase complex